MIKMTRDEIMEQRRLDRLKNLTFFMTDPRAPKVLALGAAHSLLTGWFENSPWRTAWFCIRRAIGNSWMSFRITGEYWYYQYVLRLSEDEIDERFCK